MVDWLGCIEGYYGKPYTHTQRIEFMRWMGTEGMNVFAYAPKDDPFHREKWREPYPSADLDKFAELVAAGRDAGVDFCYTISPGLDWADGDGAALASKLRAIADATECRSFGVLWDDVPAGEADLGKAHALGTAAAVDAVPDARWWSVTTDYALDTPTPYLSTFCRELPQTVTVSWTGTAVVPVRITGEQARKLGDELGRKLLLWENFPVNDGMMGGVLHLGPYPDRDADLVDASAGVLLNTMEYELASRIGVACGARFWRDPSSDREAVWRDVVASVSGLEPLARASRSWVGSPKPDAELVAWAEAAPDDKRLREFLEAGCRDGLDEAFATEVSAWLDAWDEEARVMLLCLDILERGYRSARRGMGGGVLWTNARRREKQIFGIRGAVYPVMEMRGTTGSTFDEATVAEDNLTDMLARRALTQPLA